MESKGFTLVELLISIVMLIVMLVIAGFVIAGVALATFHYLL